MIRQSIGKCSFGVATLLRLVIPCFLQITYIFPSFNTCREFLTHRIISISMVFLNKYLLSSPDLKVGVSNRKVRFLSSIISYVSLLIDLITCTISENPVVRNEK